MSEITTQSTAKKKGGRPRKGEKPRVPYQELDNLLVKGEIVASEDGEGTKVVYPTYSELAKRYGVSKSTISVFSTKRNCRRRRMALKNSIKLRPEQLISDFEG